MKLLLLSDKESPYLWDYYQPGRLAPYDLILSCGGLNARYLSFLVTMSRAPLLYVHGNHDVSYQYLLFEGRHEPIITPEQWEQVKKAQKSRQHSSVRMDRKPANPFTNLLVCEKCGYSLRRNIPSASQTKTRTYRPWYRCATKGCDCMITYCDVLEEKVVQAMQRWWSDFSLNLDGKVDHADEAQRQLSLMNKQMQTLLAQQNNICSLLERGLYTEEMFLKRNSAISNEIQNLKVSIEQMKRTCHNNKEISEAQELFLPIRVHIFDCYGMMTVEEKNRFWKLLMKKITYYRSPIEPDKIEIHLYPKLGKLVTV